MNRTHFRWLAAGMFVLLAGQPAAAQLKIAYDAQTPGEDVQRIALRPNVAQPIYFSYYNPGPGVKKNVTITLVQVTLDAAGKEKTKELAKTVVAKVDVKKSAPVSFPGQPAPKDPKDAAAWPKIEGPPFALRFLINDGATKNPLQIDVPVKLQEPRQIVKMREARYDVENKRLSFKLYTTEAFDPPCPLKLVLQPSAIPGLIANVQGTTEQTLSKANQDVELSASNIEFEGGTPPKNGRIYITVDGYERAFMYTCAFTEGSLSQLKDETRARLVVKRYLLPSAKTLVNIEIDPKSRVDGDDDPLQSSLVEINFDRAGQGNYETALGSPFRGLRELSVEYKAEGEALIFKTTVKDRVVELNTAGINGVKRLLQLRLSTKTLGVIPIANEQDIREEKVGLFSQGPENKFAPLSFNKNDSTVTAELILDSTPPEDMTLLGVPLRVRQEERLKPRLTVKPRTIGMQAPLEKIVFFIGEADKDHNLPKEAVKFEAVWDNVQKAYVPKEEMLVPADKLGKLFVSAHAETATGVAMSKKQPITVISKDAQEVAGAAVLTTIAGTVKRGERAQPDLTVVLAKAKPDKNDVPKQAKTTVDGKFEFTDVEPGNYVIGAQLLDTFARKLVPVKKNEERIKVDLELKTK